MRIIAFYLPQFHSIPENDKWWGKGFTEWETLKKAKPLFEGHVQPKIPQNKNYYNLLDEQTFKWQIQIAKKNGIFGFCFYHYWFDGHLLLEKPIEMYLKNPDLNFPFCLCWANPSWRSTWTGEGKKVLIEQKYKGKEQWEKHFLYLLPFFKDSRYIKENGEPLLVIYDVSEIPNLEEMVTYIRQRAVEEGFPGIKLLYQYYLSPQKDKEVRVLFDYCINFQPIYALMNIEKRNVFLKMMRRLNDFIRNTLNVNIKNIAISDVRKTSYDDVWKQIIEEKPRDNKDIAGAFVGWDNTPRKGKQGRVIVGATPKKFEFYLKKLSELVKSKYSTDYVFITAWNEWTEGSYLEPDEENGDDYLKVIKRVVGVEEYDVENS